MIQALDTRDVVVLEVDVRQVAARCETPDASNVVVIEIED